MDVVVATSEGQRVRRLSGIVLGLQLVLTALFLVAGLGADGSAATMFALLAASVAVGAIASVLTLRSATRLGEGQGLVTAALVLSVALLVGAATRDGGWVLPLAMAPLLLLEWWQVKGLRDLASS